MSFVLELQCLTLKISEPVPQKKMANPFALGRPKASTDMLQRQGSFRGFSKLQEAVSPFKRSVSLRLGDLPSTLQRQNAVADTSPTKSVSRANTGENFQIPKNY